MTSIGSFWCFYANCEHVSDFVLINDFEKANVYWVIEKIKDR